MEDKHFELLKNNWIILISSTGLVNILIVSTAFDKYGIDILAYLNITEITLMVIPGVYSLNSLLAIYLSYFLLPGFIINLYDISYNNEKFKIINIFGVVLWYFVIQNLYKEQIDLTNGLDILILTGLLVFITIVGLVYLSHKYQVTNRNFIIISVVGYLVMGSHFYTKYLANNSVTNGFLEFELSNGITKTVKLSENLQLLKKTEDYYILIDKSAESSIIFPAKFLKFSKLESSKLERWIFHIEPIFRNKNKKKSIVDSTKNSISDSTKIIKGDTIRIDTLKR